MAQNVEPMDVDSEFDNKENSYHHSNVLPCTEKGYEELDVSELNMKLRYSVTPVSSPMSKSCTTHVDKTFDIDTLNGNEANLTRSLNSNMNKSDVIKTLKSLPLQALPSEKFIDGNGNPTITRHLDHDNTDINVLVTGPNDIDENLSLPSSSSSELQTPATTPTKDIKNDGSPIMRGLKSVLNMFRASQSPIPSNEADNNLKDTPTTDIPKPQTVASTPIAAHRNKDGNSRKSSPLKDSISFNDDLEKELNWEDETTIIFSHEKIPVHKLFLLPSNKTKGIVEKEGQSTNVEDNLNATVEYMDVSYSEPIADRTMTDVATGRNDVTVGGESDSEFQDCETTFNKTDHNLDNNNATTGENTNLPPTDTPKNLPEELSIINQNLTSNETKTDITFTDGDQNNVSVPSDYSNYSKETTEILSELEKIEATVSPKSNTLEVNKTWDDNNQNEKQQNVVINLTQNEENIQVENVLNITKEVPGNEDPPAPTENLILDKEKLNVQMDNVLNITMEVVEQQCKADITQPLEPAENILNITETVSDQECNVTQPIQPIENIILDKETQQNENILNISKEITDKEFNANTTAPIVATENILLEKEIPQKIRQTENELNITKEIINKEDTSNLTEPIEATENILNITKDITDKEDTANATAPIENTENLVLTKEMLQDNVETENALNITKEVAELECNTNIESYEPIDNIILNRDTQGENLQNESMLNITKDITIQECNANLTQTYDIIDVNNVPEKEAYINEGNITNDLPQNTVQDVLNVTYVDTMSNNVIEENAEISDVRGYDNVDTKIADIDNSCVGIEPTPVDKMLEKSSSANQVCELSMQQEKSSELPNDKICEEIVSMPTVNSISSQDKVNEAIPNPEKPTELTLSNDEFCKEVAALPTVVSNIIQDEMIDNPEKEKPADVPLPDDDDDGKDSLEIPLNTLRLSPSVIQDVPIIETQIENTCEILNNTVTNAVPDIVNAQNSEQKIDNTGTISVENIPDVNIDATEIVSALTENVSKASEVTQLDITEMNKTQELLKHHEELPEVVSECKTPVFETCDLNQSQVINSSKILDVTLYKDNSAHVLNDNENVEAMDATMNETLKTNELPDLVNQTIIISEENDNNSTTTSETPIVPPEIPMEIDNVGTPLKNKEYIENNDNIKTFNEATEQNNLLDNAIKDDIKIDGQPLGIDNEQIVIAPTGTIDEEIIVSENNSPYVSLMAGLDKISDKTEQNLEDIENPMNTTTSVPSSPPIKSRGYNFNFDDMDDPFNTKNKIRLSPSLDTSTSVEPENEDRNIDVPKRIAANRRKSQPVDRKKPSTLKKKLNATFNAPLTSKMSVNEDEIKVKSVKEKLSVADYIRETSQVNLNQENPNPILTKHDEIITSESKVEVENDEKEFDNNEENKTSIDSITSVSNDAKIPSLEQSTYYSAGTSSTDSAKTKNVFNLPEIDDINFNPFATKSKIRQSPQRDAEMENPFATRTKILNSPDSSMIVPPHVDLNNKETLPGGHTQTQVDKVDSADKTETELMEKDTSANTSSTTAPINQNTTVRETNTEDEDTEEGPFLEAEDIIDKMSDFDDGNVDMMQFNELPAPGLDDNGGELFIDAEAYEFLLNQNQCNMVAESGKESLFLKFDPLFANKISSDGVLAALDKVQRKQSTPTKPARPSLKNEASPIAGPSTLNTTYECDNNVSQETNDDLNVTVAKPMMVVTPAVNPAVTPRTKSTTPTRSNRRSITFTSPAIAVIDRLLSMSSNNSFVGHDTTISPSREQNEADLALTQLRELLAEKEISVYNLRYENKELQDRLSTMESQIRTLEADGQGRLKNINELNERLMEKTKINKSMAAVVEEYERTIASLIAETEQDKKRNAEERMRLINERDEQTAHLASMEVSFSDLHSKYEKSKQVILACKANEDAYKKSIKDFEENLNKAQSNYELLKQHATSKLNHANQELEKMNRSHEVEVVKLNALIKRKELHVKSLEETLAQKTKDNDELTAICDELINKV